MLLELHQQIKNFDKKKLESLRSFLQVSYLHKQQLTGEKLGHVVHLMEELFRLKKTSQDKLDQSIQGTARFMRNFQFSIKTLDNLIDQFLFWEEHKKSAVCQLEKIKHYYPRDPEKALELTLDLQTKLNAKNDKSESDYALWGESTELIYYHPLTKKETKPHLLEQCIHQNTLAYLMRILRLQVEMFVQQYTFDMASSKDHQALHLPLDLIEAYAAQNVAIKMHHDLVTLWQNPRQESLAAYINQYFQCFEQLPNDDRSLIGNYLITLSNRLYERTGDQAFQQQMFKLYAFFRSHMGVFQGYFQNAVFFSSAVAVAASTKQRTWALELMELMKDHFPSSKSSFTLELARARMELFSGNYDAAQDILQRLYTYAKEPFVIIAVHMSSIMLYLVRLNNTTELFDQDGYIHEARQRIIQPVLVLLENRLDTLAQALRRDELLNDSRIESYYNFIHIVHNVKRVLMKEDININSPRQLLERIMACTPLASKGWLIDFVKTRILKK
jgi:hypothetical protein